MIGNEHEYDTLLGPLLSFGQQMLDTYGAFYPYAAVVEPDGGVALVARDVEEETPRPAGAEHRSGEALDVFFPYRKCPHVVASRTAPRCTLTS